MSIEHKNNSVFFVGSEELITKLWREYLTEHEAKSSKFVPYYYKQVSRRAPQARKFEDLLFVKYGATVRQRDKKFYLEFTDQGQALLFALMIDVK